MQANLASRRPAHCEARVKHRATHLESVTAHGQGIFARDSASLQAGIEQFAKRLHRHSCMNHQNYHCSVLV